MQFHILGSSSSGNCSLLLSSDTKVLIDAGFSGKKIETYLNSIGEDIMNIDAVFLTHEHSDHSIGIAGLSKYEHIRFYANYHTAEAIQSKLKRKIDWMRFETGTQFRHGSLEVRSFSIPHDAYDPVGFVFRSGYEGDLINPRTSLAWATDLGYIPDAVKEHLKDVDFLVIEANYDHELLEEDTKRPFSIKQRIRGRHGHLSNEVTFDYLSQTQNSTWKHVCLAHLSRDCNSLSAVQKTFKPLIDNENRKFTFSIVDPDAMIPASFDLIGHETNLNTINL